MKPLLKTSDGMKDGVFLKSLRAIVRPIIRICLRNRIGYQLFARVVREEYVRVASEEEEFWPLETKQTASNIALLTGVNRRDIKTILNTPSAANAKSNDCAESAVLAAWKTDPRFSANGQPLELTSGHQGSFSQLVGHYGRSVSYGPILHSLIEAGCVKRLPGMKLRMLSPTFVPNQADEDLLKMGAMALSRIASTIGNNLAIPEGQAKQFQREIWSAECPPDKVAGFIHESHKMCLDFLAASDQFLEVGYEEGCESPGQMKVGIGFYTFTEDDEK